MEPPQDAEARPEDGSLRGCLAGAIFGLVFVTGVVVLATRRRAELELAYDVRQAENGEPRAISSLVSHPGGLPPLAKLCGSDNEETQRAALIALGDLLHERFPGPLSAGQITLSTAPIIAATRSDSARVRRESLRILARLPLGGPELAALEGGLRDSDREVSLAAGRSLAAHGSAGIPALLAGCRSDHHNARIGAHFGLTHGLRSGTIRGAPPEVLALVRESLLSKAPDALAGRTSSRRLLGEQLLFEIPAARVEMFVELLPKVSHAGARSLVQHLQHWILEGGAGFEASVPALLKLAQGSEPGSSRALVAIRSQLLLRPSRSATRAALRERLQEPGLDPREARRIKALLAGKG